MHNLKAPAILLHRQLLDSLILLCQDRETTLDKKLETAVQVCVTSLNELYGLLPEDLFEDRQEQIFFFKSIKPLFAAEREYHQRLYHAVIFGEDSGSFWDRELSRMEKLLNEHGQFAAYLHNGHSHYDHDWFRQGQAPFPTALCTWPWETNPKHTSARDGWVAGLMAVERYRDWLHAKIQNEKGHKAL